MSATKESRVWKITAMAIVGVSFVVLVAVWATWFAADSRVYCLEAQFGVLPADDVPFEEWLKLQPGVIPHTASVKREPLTKLIVVFMQTGSLVARPKFPDLEQAARDFGYREPDGKFRDSARQ